MVAWSYSRWVGGWEEDIWESSGCEGKARRMTEVVECKTSRLVLENGQDKYEGRGSAKMPRYGVW